MQRRHVLLALLVAAAWGVNFVAAKWAVQDFSPLFANTMRFTCVALIFCPFLKIVKGKMVLLLCTAFILGVVHFGITFWAIQVADGVGAVAIASQLTVPFSTILAIIFLKESVGWKRIGGISLSFGGVLIIGFDPVVFSYLHGLLLMVCAAFLYSISAILMRSLKDVSVLTVQAWVGLAAMVGSGLLSAAFETGQIDAIQTASNEAWIGVLYSALGASVIGHGFANYLFKEYEVTVVAPYFLVVPIFAMITGVLVLDEEITSRMVLGGAVTIFGVLIVTLRNTVRASKVASVVKIEG